jgi:hypothetical protein
MSGKSTQQSFKEAVERINRAGLTVEDASVISDNFLDALELVGRHADIEVLKSISQMAVDNSSLATLEALAKGAQEDDTGYDGEPDMDRLAPIIQARLALIAKLAEDAKQKPLNQITTIPLKKERVAPQAP